MNKHASGLVLTAAISCASFLGQAAASTNACLANDAIALAPYVQALSADSYAVQWQTVQPAYGWVEWGETPALGNKTDASALGLKVANETMHRVRLAGLKEGSAYWYRIAFKPIRRFDAYRVDFESEQRSELKCFRTLPGPDQPLVAVIFNDLHHQTNTFNQLCSALGETPFDFSLFNGDCLADLMTQPQLLRSLATYNQGAKADSRPVFFLRGNHEARGVYARELPRWLAWPGEKPYFGFSAGAVRFLVLDLGEDKPDDHPEYSGLADFESYRREETEWIKREVASSAFRQAAWRVLVHHIPIHAGKTNAFSFPERELWAGLLAEAKIDLAIHGHLHAAAFHPLNTVGNSYPIAVGGGPQVDRATVMVLEADQHHLKLRILDHRGREKFPAFEQSR